MYGFAHKRSFIFSERAKMRLIFSFTFTTAITGARGIFRGGFRFAPNHLPDISRRRENDNHHDNYLNIHNSFKFQITDFRYQIGFASFNLESEI